MSKCDACFRYRSKEKEIDALRHELGLMEAENKWLREVIGADDQCVMTAREVQWLGGVKMYGGAGAAGPINAAYQQSLAQQKAMTQQQMAAQIAQQQQSLGGGGAAWGMQNSLGQQHAHAMANAVVGGVGVTAAIYGSGGAGGAGGNGGAGCASSAEAWCETHQRWGRECNTLRERLMRWGKELIGCTDVTA
jgi:hypothetical protein